MLRRAFLGSGMASALGAAAKTRANVIIATADNLGYGDMGCYGNTAIRTPHLDRFARDGVRFINFYTASPTCTASRAALLTGRHPVRYGLNYQLSARENQSGIGLPHTERLLPQYLKPHGYRTACIGKWNLGFAEGSRPTERGFDEFLGLRSGNFDYNTHLYRGEHDLYKGVEPFHAEGYSTDLFADAACDFVRRSAGSPFFLYLPFNAPHYESDANTPGKKGVWQAPAKYFDTYGYSPDITDPKKRYQAVVTALDDGFGRVMAQLDRLRLAENTLVFFFSDNGAFMTPGHGLEVAANRPLRGGGVTCWEGGIRVAAMARWPGRTKPGTVCNELLSSMDLLPLALRAAGEGTPGNARLDGRDPSATIAGKKSPHEALFFVWERQQAVRHGKWKLIRTVGQPWQLFDLAADTGETNDVAAAHTPVVRDLGLRFARWSKV
ncbi:MAG: sulfatase-like hydrolase/transferase [Bryobacteraceae bacterium]